MKEETLTAKKWLEKEGKLFETPLYNSACEYYMEKYANYKNRILEDRIKEFGKLLNNEQIHATNDSITMGYKMHNLLNLYNICFNIKE